MFIFVEQLNISIIKTTNMGSEFNGKKFDIWSGYSNEYAVWNNHMKCVQYVDDWEGTIAPSKEAAKEMARKKNLEFELVEYNYKNRDEKV